MDENIHAQMLDEQLKKLRAELAEKEKREKEKKANNNTLLTFVERHGIRLPAKPLEQFNLPLFAIIYALLSLKSSDKKLRALREDLTLMGPLRTALSRMENPSASMPLPGFPESFELSPELSGFLGKILCYLAHAYPAELMDFLFVHEKFFYLLLRNSKEWTKTDVPKTAKPDPSTLTISHALHLLALHDMEKGSFAAKKFLTVLIAFLDAVASMEDTPNDAFLCAMSLTLQSSRSLFKVFQGRSTKNEFYINGEDLPASLISKTTIAKALKLTTTPESGVILPFLQFMAKLDCHGAQAGRSPTVAPALYELEVSKPTLSNFAADNSPLHRLPRKDLYLYGTCGQLSLTVVELWVQVFLSFQQGNMALKPQQLIPILKTASDALCNSDTTAVLRNQMGSLIRSFLPLCNPTLLSQLELVKTIKGVFAADVKKCIPQAKLVFQLLKSQPWLSDSVKEDVVDSLIKLMASEKKKGPHLDGVSKEIEQAQAALRMQHTAVQRGEESSRQVEMGEQAVQKVKDLEAKMAALTEAKKQKMKETFEQIQFHSLTPDMLEGKEGEYLRKNVNYLDDKGRTMLHIACMAGNQTMVDFLVAIPAITKKSFDHSGKSPRHCTLNPILLDILDRNGIA